MEEVHLKIDKQWAEQQRPSSRSSIPSATIIKSRPLSRTTMTLIDHHFSRQEPGGTPFWFEKQLIYLRSCYNLLSQIGWWALGGHIQLYWSDIIESTLEHVTGNMVGQQNKFQKRISKLNMKNLGSDTVDMILWWCPNSDKNARVMRKL